MEKKPARKEVIAKEVVDEDIPLEGSALQDVSMLTPEVEGSLETWAPEKVSPAPLFTKSKKE